MGGGLITDKTQFGDYYCMVMDDLFCGAVYSITISEFKPVNYVVSEINEKGDTAVLRAILSDFTSNSITYNWNTGQHTQTIKVAPPIAGSYTVNVIDNSIGCSNSSVGVLKSNAKVFIFLSSVKAVKDNDIENLTEEIIPNP